MAAVYVAPEVQRVLALHPYLNDAGFRALSIRDQIARQSETIHRAFHEGDTRVAIHILSWRPGRGTMSVEAALAEDFSKDDAFLTMSREYGFADTDKLDALGDLRLDPAFEQALDQLLAGDETALSARLEATPGLATARTPLGHRSTLLHYLGANGVETHRQVTPLNAPDLARMLIFHGADPAAEADMYSGGQTPFDLARTSAHPAKAGILDDLLVALKP